MFIVSSCLAGIACKYDGSAKPNDEIISLVNLGKAIPACPECLAGIKRPSPPAEIFGGDGLDVLQGRACVYNNIGENMTQHFIQGAEKFLKFVVANNAECVMLKSKSPSCGISRIYNGRFDGTLIKGCGVAAALLIKNGIKVVEID